MVAVFQLAPKFEVTGAAARVRPVGQANYWDLLKTLEYLLAGLYQAIIFAGRHFRFALSIDPLGEARPWVQRMGVFGFGPTVAHSSVGRRISRTRALFGSAVPAPQRHSLNGGMSIWSDAEFSSPF